MAECEIRVLELYDSLSSRPILQPNVNEGVVSTLHTFALWLHVSLSRTMKHVIPVSFHTKHFNTEVTYRTGLPKVLTVITVFYDPTPCSLVGIYVRFDNPENVYSTFI
jgi:hypothetical protein